MELINNISMTFIYIYALTISLLLIAPRMETKKYIWISCVSMGLLIAANVGASVVLGKDVMDQYLLFTLSLPSFLYFMIMSKHHDGRVIFAFCFGDMTVLVSDFLSNVAYYLSGGSAWCLILGRLLLPLLAILFIWKYLRKYYLEITEAEKGGWWLLSVIAILFYVFLVKLSTEPTAIANRPEDMLLLAAAIAIMILSFVVMFRAISNQLKIIHYEQTEKLMELQIHSFENTIKTLEHNEKTLRILRHDLKHYENGLRSLLQTGSTEEIMDYINSSSEIMQIDEPVIYCESAALNSILAFSICLAEENGCTVHTKFALTEKLPVSDIELCMVFANAIENAVNACKKIPDASNRIIKITCLDNPQFVLEVANTYTGTILLDETGIPMSTKKGHGYGTQSIRAFAEKHNACWTTT